MIDPEVTDLVVVPVVGLLAVNAAVTVDEIAATAAAPVAAAPKAVAPVAAPE